jgi:hypothetical protein
MLGGQAKGQPDPQQEVGVDLILEQDISAVEQAVDIYLQNPNESLRRDLLRKSDPGRASSYACTSGGE